MNDVVAKQGAARWGGFVVVAGALVGAALSAVVWGYVTTGTGDTTQAWSGLMTLLMAPWVALVAVVLVHRFPRRVGWIVAAEVTLLMAWPLLADGPF